MSAWDKLIKRIENADKDLRFEELKKVLERYGYSMKRPKGGSSHATFRKPGKSIITIPTGYPINIAYIKMVRDIVVEKDGELD